MKKLFTILAAAIYLNVNAQVCFNPITNFAVGSQPYSICSGDFNGDGKADLVTVNSNTDSVSILIGNGSGSFGSATNFATGTNPSSVITADFNGDGKADLATGNSDSTVSILLGNGLGGFGVPANFYTSSYNGVITSADFNGDGKADIAAASNYLEILLGAGTGSFGSPLSFWIGYQPYSITSEDFNGDGKFDIATANRWGNNISVLLGTGTGSFGTVTDFNSGISPASIVSRDFNGDGKADLATANYNQNNISVLLGTGTGSFSAFTNFSTGGSVNNPQSFSIIGADFNGDTKVDLAVANSNAKDVSVLLGTGAGSFLTADTFAVDNSPYSVISADFNNDGKIDLATANHGSNNVSVLLNAPLLTVSVNATANTICPGSSSVLTASGSTTYNWNTSATTSTISVTPTITTTYSVTDGSGCSNTASITINVATAETPDICMVTTDSATNYKYNIIYWDKTLYSHVDSFIVYRYDVMSSSYLRIGAVSKNSLSEFKDTAFSIGGPNGGNPLYSSWQYKLAIRDTCGNIGAKSPYHESMFVQESGATFSWNAYTVETGQSNPVTGYSFLRDDNNTGAWHVLVNTAGLSTTDPNYSSFPNGNWRVDALGFNCTATLFRVGNNNNTSSITNKKSHSNTSKPTSVGINKLSANNTKLNIYPNPSSDNITIQSSAELGVISIYNSLGEIISQTKSKNMQEQIDISNLAAGVYTVQVQEKYLKLIKE